MSFTKVKCLFISALFLPNLNTWASCSNELALYSDTRSIPLDWVLESQLREARKSQLFLEKAIREAHQEAPHSPLARAKQMIERTKESGYSKSVVPLDEEGRAQYKGNSFRDLHAVESPGNTVWFLNGEMASGKWEPPSGAEALVILLPGWGLISATPAPCLIP